ncbi:hypothetical protein C8R44DRAFT_865290 [Mycena epipterygia]|nr:hypothetical protein C8R44DRAFT_865290 [Mycena epipterygia]
MSDFSISFSGLAPASETAPLLPFTACGCGHASCPGEYQWRSSSPARCPVSRFVFLASRFPLQARLDERLLASSWGRREMPTCRLLDRGGTFSLSANPRTENSDLSGCLPASFKCSLLVFLVSLLSLLLTACNQKPAPDFLPSHSNRYDFHFGPTAPSVALLQFLYLCFLCAINVRGDGMNDSSASFRPLNSTLTSPEFHELLHEYDIMFFAETDMLPGEDEATDVPVGYTLISLPRKPRMTGSRRGGGVPLLGPGHFYFNKIPSELARHSGA